MVQSNDHVTAGIMPDEEEMTNDERTKYLRINQKQYASYQEPADSNMTSTHSRGMPFACNKSTRSRSGMPWSSPVPSNWDVTRFGQKT
jgi:hypothetical protein